jgi:hypothetical protein
MVHFTWQFSDVSETGKVSSLKNMGFFSIIPALPYLL